MRVSIFCILLFLSISCARKDIRTAKEAMRPVPQPEAVVGDDDLQGLSQAIERQLAVKPESMKADFRFGEFLLDRACYWEELRKLKAVLESSDSVAQKEAYLKGEFEWHEVYGIRDWGDVFITGYYMPVFQASSKKTERHSRAIYQRPKDIVEIELWDFADEFEEKRFFNSAEIKKNKRNRRLAARKELVNGKERIFPYWSREEIDSGGALEGRGLEIAWLDPVDAFFLQIQGSGVLQLEGNKTLFVSYDSQNGHPHVPIGKFLFHIIALEEMTAKKISDHLKSIDASEAQSIMNLNPSYVFFSPVKKGARTTIGVSATAERSIAIDPTFFSLGSLAHLSFVHPEHVTEENAGEIPPTDSRYVLAQDTGGGIRGPGRVDLYWGQGTTAEALSGVMRHRGVLHFLRPNGVKCVLAQDN